MNPSRPTSASSSKTLPGRASIWLAFLSVYFFWGSTYTAIRIGASEMPALLLSGVRVLLAGGVLLAWCRFRGMRLWWPAREMSLMALVGILLLCGGNVGLCYAEQTISSGLSSLLLAGIPLMVALAEMLLPGGEPLPKRGWIGLAIGFASLALLLWPTLRVGLAGNWQSLFALLALEAGSICWAAGSLVSRRARLTAPSLVAASWQMIAAGVVSTTAGSALGEWPRFHLNPTSIASLAWLITGGSLIGYTCFIWLLEHVPATKVASHSYVNPVVAVLLGIALLHERPAPSEYAGMAGVVLAVFLLTTARVRTRS